MPITPKPTNPKDDRPKSAAKVLAANAATAPVRIAVIQFVSTNAKKNQQVTEVKPLRLSPVIDKHDFETKLKQASGWIDDGLKVKIDMRFRGRMMTRQEIGIKVMNDFIEALSEKAKIDKAPNLEGNIMSCVLTPIKK